MICFLFLSLRVIKHCYKSDVTKLQKMFWSFSESKSGFGIKKCDFADRYLPPIHRPWQTSWYCRLRLTNHNTVFYPAWGKGLRPPGKWFSPPPKEETDNAYTRQTKIYTEHNWIQDTCPLPFFHTCCIVSRLTVDIHSEPKHMLLNSLIYNVSSAIVFHILIPQGLG